MPIWLAALLKSPIVWLLLALGIAGGYIWWLRGDIDELQGKLDQARANAAIAEQAAKQNAKVIEELKDGHAKALREMAEAVRIERIIETRYQKVKVGNALDPQAGDAVPAPVNGFLRRLRESRTGIHPGIPDDRGAPALPGSPVLPGRKPGT